MSAKTAWWFCGQCGFQNHPRRDQDNTKCEQCGHSQLENPASSPEAAARVLADVDYTPRAGGFNA